jgi:hypothetical protein
VNCAPLVKSMKLGTVVDWYNPFHLSLGSGLCKSNMAAKIQDGRHILKISENFSITAVVITRTVWNNTNSLYFTLNNIRASDPSSVNLRWPTIIQDGRHILIFSGILKFFSRSHYRSVWNNTTLLYCTFICIQACDLGLTNPRWLTKSKMAAILKMLEYDIF